MHEADPCPFCGGSPEFENTDERARLRCTGCGAEGGLFFYSQEECESGIGEATEARAIAAWNTRNAGVTLGAQPEPTGWLEWRDGEWKYHHNTIYIVDAPKNTTVRIALYAALGVKGNAK